MSFKLTADQLQKILNYLSSRPWAEVNNLIIELSKLEKIEEGLKETTKPLSKV
jgi:hypothetical protein